jgi:hypothetical protein
VVRKVGFKGVGVKGVGVKGVGDKGYELTLTKEI